MVLQVELISYVIFTMYNKFRSGCCYECLPIIRVLFVDVHLDCCAPVEKVIRLVFRVRVMCSFRVSVKF